MRTRRWRRRQIAGRAITALLDEYPFLYDELVNGGVTASDIKALIEREFR